MHSGRTWAFMVALLIHRDITHMTLTELKSWLEILLDKSVSSSWWSKWWLQTLLCGYLYWIRNEHKCTSVHDLGDSNFKCIAWPDRLSKLHLRRFNVRLWIIVAKKNCWIFYLEKTGFNPYFSPWFSSLTNSVVLTVSFPSKMKHDFASMRKNAFDCNRKHSLFVTRIFREILLS